MSSTTNKEEKKCCDLCEGNHSLFTGNARIDCPCHTPQSVEEEELIELLKEMSIKENWNAPATRIMRIKEIFSTQKHLSYNQGVADGKREVVEKIEGKMNEYEYHKDEVHCTCLGALREYLQDIKDTLSNQVGNNK